MKTLRDYFLHHEFRLAVYALLGGATVLCLILAGLRPSEYEGSQYTYDFLVRNLFLAWIPFVIALITQGLVLSRKRVRGILLIGCLLWLLFFPNAPYLLTDFQHLRLYSDSPEIWYDVILVIWFAFTGLLLGIVSLYTMHRLVERSFGQRAGWAFVLFTALLSSAGIYIGRFLRFRSWEIFLYLPHFTEVLLRQRRDTIAGSIVYVALYTLFTVFIYVVFYTFGNLMQEDMREQGGEAEAGVEGR